MVVHAVKFEDLDFALKSARNEAELILQQINAAQNRLAETDFAGEQADALEAQMNDKMAQFVNASYENIDAMLLTMVRNMNVVVTKLGGRPWDHIPVERGAVSTAVAKSHRGGNDYIIDLDRMSDFANDVDKWFEDIVSSYNNLRSTVVDRTPGWVGPEKDKTVADVETAIQQIIGTAGGEGTGVRAVGASLSGWLREQVSVMENG